MPQIYTIGETLLDIIFEENLPKIAKAGGSTLNSSVTMGRLGLPVSFISEWGNDYTGKIIDTFLNENHVNTRYVYRFKEGKTALALAFLNENKNASYSFYKIYPEKRFQITFPEIKPGDIVLFASFYAITAEVRQPLFNFVKQAKKQGAFIIYDPNFRANHLEQLPGLMPMFLENFKIADLVRASDEDFQNLFNAYTPDEAYKKLTKAGCSNLIYTASNKGIWLNTIDISKEFPVQQIKPVSTIGAGDTFNAGLIYGLYKFFNEVGRYTDIPEHNWDSIIETAAGFATQVCMSWDNYISPEYASKYRIYGN